MSIFKLACIEHPDIKVSVKEEHLSEIITGPYAGMSLARYIKQKGEEILGLDAADFDSFPYMVSWKTLQEPKVYNPHKAKMWMIIKAAAGGQIYLGTSSVLDDSWQNQDALIDSLNPVTPYAGETFFIQPGLIAAAGSGITLLNIEQEANLTKAVLHLEPVKVDCKVSGPFVEDGSSVTRELCVCDQFGVTRTRVNGRVEFDCGRDSFGVLIMVDQNGLVEHDGTTLHVQCGDTVFIEAGTYDVKVTGNCTYVYIRV